MFTTKQFHRKDKLIGAIITFLMLFSGYSLSQVPQCIDASPFCSDSSYVFENSTQNSAGQSGAPIGPNYGCLSNQPNPIWYFMRIADDGNILLNLAQVNNSGTGIDIDFAMWGPFDDLEEGCNDIMSGNLSPLQCSYSASTTETIGIGVPGGSNSIGQGASTPPPAVAGEYYILILTNYSGQAGTISLEQTNSGNPNSGMTDCSIIGPCDYDVVFTNHLNVCEGETVDLNNAFDQVNSDPTENSFFETFSNAMDSINPLNDTEVGEGGYYMRSNSLDSVGCTEINKITVEEGIDDASFQYDDFCFGNDVGPKNIATPGGNFSFATDPNDGAMIDEETGEIYDGVAGTTYSVEYTTTQGCPNSEIIDVKIYKIPDVTIPTEVEICKEDSLVLTAENPDNVNISWSNGIEDGEAFIPQEDTAYYYLNAENELCSITDSVKVIVNPLPPFPNFGADFTTVCKPGPAVFDNYTNEYPGQNLDCIWSFGDGETINNCDSIVNHNYDATGIYDISLTIVNQYGCERVKNVPNYIEVIEGPTANFTADPTQTDLNNTGVDFSNNSSEANHYDWDFGDGTGSSSTHPSHDFPTDEPGTYNVILYASNSVNPNCVDSSSVEIEIIQPNAVYKIPNIFTPNGDGVNDVFKLQESENIYGIEVVVLNRWGDVVFESTEVNFEWNGKVKNNGSECTDGIYFYKMNIESYGGNVEKEYGYVHLNREKGGTTE